jgi:hypothetical protein
MRFSELIEGLQILAKYEEKGLEAHINGADHDVISAASAEVDEDAPVAYDEDEEPIRRDTRLSTQDDARLRELGWFVSEEYGDVWICFC